MFDPLGLERDAIEQTMLRHAIVSNLQLLAEKTDQSRSDPSRAGVLNDVRYGGRNYPLGVEYEGQVKHDTSSGEFEMTSVKEGKQQKGVKRKL